MVVWFDFSSHADLRRLPIGLRLVHSHKSRGGRGDKGFRVVEAAEGSNKARQPTAIRVTLNRCSIADEEHPINRLFLVHETGELELLSSGSALSELRSAAAALAEFLRVEQYEDRLHQLKGAYVHQSGSGVGPTCTYVDRWIAARRSPSRRTWKPTKTSWSWRG